MSCRGASTRGSPHAIHLSETINYGRHAPSCSLRARARGTFSHRTGSTRWDHRHRRLSCDSFHENSEQPIGSRAYRRRTCGRRVQGRQSGYRVQPNARGRLCRTIEQTVRSRNCPGHSNALFGRSTRCCSKKWRRPYTSCPGQAGVRHTTKPVFIDKPLASTLEDARGDCAPRKSRRCSPGSAHQRCASTTSSPA